MTNFYSYTDITNIDKECHKMEGKGRHYGAVIVYLPLLSTWSQFRDVKVQLCL